MTETKIKLIALNCFTPFAGLNMLQGALLQLLIESGNESECSAPGS
jgi:hypothetical protein